MKRIMKALALLLSIGAAVQVLTGYAAEREEISSETEGAEIIRLIELKNDSNSNDEALNEELVIHTLKYLKSIKAENTLREVLKKKKFMSVDGHGEPGV